LFKGILAPPLSSTWMRKMGLEFGIISFIFCSSPIESKVVYLTPASLAFMSSLLDLQGFAYIIS